MRWHWQYLGVLVLAIFNIDLVLIPILKKLGVSGMNLFWIGSFWATIELLCRYWFWIWFRKVVIPETASQKIAESEYLQEGIELGTELKSHLQQHGYLQKLENYFIKTYSKATDENNRIVKWIRRGGHTAMLLLGIDPYPGGRTIGVIFCGIFGWRKHLYALAIGNIIHIAYIVGAWNMIL